LLANNLHFNLAYECVSVIFNFVMKTYVVHLPGAKALPILEEEREEVASRLAELDTDIAKIRQEMGMEETTTNGHPVRTRTRSVASVVNAGLNHLNGVLDKAISNGIEKTAKGRSAKGQTERSILNYLKAYPRTTIATTAVAKALGANYSTAYRSLKKLEEKGFVSFDGAEWHKGESLPRSAQ
jgi:sugar-specific transcriptional regulator TrmB